MVEPDKKTILTLTEIRSGKAGRDRVIGRLYKDQTLRNKLRSTLYKNGGRADDFDLIFNTTLMQFVKTAVKNEEMKIKSSLHGYIIGISRYIWFQELRDRKDNRTENIDDQFDQSEGTTPESLIIDHGQKEAIAELLQKTGKNCKEVLMYWANGYKMSEIAEKVGYKSEGMAKKKKHICLKELLLFLEKNPHIKSILR